MMYMELITGRSQDDAGDPRIFTDIFTRVVHNHTTLLLAGGH